MRTLQFTLVLWGLVAFALGCPPDTAGDDDTDEEGYEAGVPGGCDDGADNDIDGLFDCDDPDCFGAPACDGEADDDASDDDEKDEDVAEVYICNGLRWGDGSNLEIGMECDGVYWEADSEECTACQDLEVGSVYCEIYVDDDLMGSFEPDFEQGDNGLLFGSEDGANISVYGLTTSCGTDWDDLT